MEHQKRALDFSLSVKHFALLMEMRLGKTLTAIRSYQLRTQRPILVVAPVTVLEAWEKELALEGEPFLVLHGKPAAKREDMVVAALKAYNRCWILINYECLRVMPLLGRVKWGGVVLDESPVIRNPGTQISQLCCDWFGNVDHRAILTGLYAPESPEDVFQQYKFLLGRFMGYSNFYKWRHNLFQQWGYGWSPKPGTRELIKMAVAETSFVLTRKQANLGSTKVYETRTVPMNAIQKKLYNRVTKDLEVEGVDGVIDEAMYTVVKQTWLARLAGGFHPDGVTLVSTAKQDELIRLLKGELRGERVIVWSRFRAEVTGNLQRLQKEGYKSDYILGGMLRGARKAKLQAFRDNELQVLSLQEKVAKFGVDVSEADTSVYYSNEYENEDRSQSEDRTISQFKRTPQLYIDLITEGSIDVDVVEKLQKKSFDSKWLMGKVANNGR